MRRKAFRWAVGLVLVVGLGAGLAVARPGWLPGWASLRGATVSTAESGPICREHGVLERYCTLCHPELKRTLRACEEHGGLPEAICTLCDPGRAGKLGLTMCPEGHGLPKSYCNKCEEATRKDGVAMVQDGWCPDHRKPEALCPECEYGKKPVSPRCRQGIPMVRLTSADTARAIGLQTAGATRQEHSDHVVGNAETAYNANLYAEVFPRVGGIVAEVLTDEGVHEDKGEVLAVIDSADVGTAKAQFLAALPLVESTSKNLNRAETLAKSNAISLKELTDTRSIANKAKADLLNARQRLLNLGFTRADLDRIAKESDTSSLLKIRSPIEGKVVTRHAVAGEAKEPTSQMFVVADTRLMWAWIDVYENQIDQVKVDQLVEFTIFGTERPVFRGKVDLLDTEVNQVTRTIRVRCEMENPEGRMRANQYGIGRIQVSPVHQAVLIPKAAVQRVEKVDVVFFPEPDGRSFRPQRVLARPVDFPGQTEIVWGVKTGQAVVTTGAFLLKTELLKDELGEGCCK